MTNSDDDLRSLIDAAAGMTAPTKAGAKLVPDVPKPRRTSSHHEDLHQALQQAHADDDARPRTVGSPSVFTRNRLLVAALLCGLLVGAAWMWNTPQATLSGPAATLHNLAQSVEQYRLSRNGSLPEQLSNLEHFPKGAVEWQLKHWKARDAAGRTEIMFAPNGSKHYRIVLRRGNEVWVYSDLDGKSRQTKP